MTTEHTQPPVMKHHLDSRTETLTVTIPGDILSTNADALREALFGLFESPAIKHGNWSVLKLDLTGAQMVDSVGLNLIVGITRTVQARQGKIHATIRSSNIYRTLLFTRLDRQIEVTKL